MAKRKHIVLTSTANGTHLAEKVAHLLRLPFSAMQRKTFADGELYHAFPVDVAGQDMIIIGSTEDDTAYQELLDLIAGSRFWNARTVNVVIPYFGYSTMERAKPGSGEIPKGVTRARQLFRARPNFVAFIDLHSESVLHAHAGEIRTMHLWTDRLAVARIEALKLRDYVLVSPDYGFSKRVGRLAGMLDCPHTAANKDRYDVDKTIVGQISSAVKGKTAIICDDMIRTGGSMLQTADRCFAAGAVKVMVMATHLVLAGDARQRFVDHGIDKIIGSDSFPGRETDKLLDVYSVAPLIAEGLRNHLRIDQGNKKKS